MLAALCLALVFAISLTSYVVMCYTSLAMSTRNLVNDHCLELAESGIEQALYAANNSDWTGWTASTAAGITTETTTMTMTASGLESPTTTTPTPLNFGNGANGTVNITVTYTAGTPTAIQSVSSQGVVTLPTGSIMSGGTPTLSRTITYGGVGTGGNASAPLFVNAVAAVSGKVKFSSGGSLDSYNSNPSAGVYQTYSAGIAGFSAVVASQDDTVTSATVAIKSAVIHGYVTGYDYSSPSSSNWLSYMTNAGKVVGPSTGTGVYIDTSRVLTSPNPYQPAFNQVNPLPNVSSNLGTVNNSNLNLGSSTATTPTVYQTNGISLNGSYHINIQGPVILINYGAVTVSSSGLGTAGIYLTGAASSLQVIQEYGDISLGACGITNSNTVGTTGIPPLPKKVAIICTNESAFNTAISMTQPFYGVVYTPLEAITVSSNAATIYGSLVGSSVSFTCTSPTLHYDLALRQPDSNLGDAAFANLVAPITVSNLVTSIP